MAAALALFATVALRLYTLGRYSGSIYGVEDAPARQVAIVFGAGVLPEGEPTPVLYDRVAAAAELYHRGTVPRLLLSGDGRPESTHEPDVMRRTALRLGVPDAALVLDNAGLRTYACCDRARREFGVTSGILVPQAFHLPRALLLCDALSIDAAGVASARRAYPWRWNVSWQVRETVATLVAWWDERRVR